MTIVHQIEEKLDSDKIKAAIACGNKATLTTLNVFEQINSTNTYLLERAKAGGHSGWICLAEQQTQGRGRQGRVWHSPARTNIYCSLLWHLPSTVPDISSLSIAVAVMVAKALIRYGLIAVELKWPNDILFAGRKLAGILIETLPTQQGSIPVVIGIGLNCLKPGAEADPAWINLAEIMQQAIDRNTMAGLLIDELLANLPLFGQQGLAPFIPEWLRYDVLHGKQIQVHTPTAIIMGVSRGISQQGELLLLDSHGCEQRFICGEVSVRGL